MKECSSPTHGSARTLGWSQTAARVVSTSPGVSAPPCRWGNKNLCHFFFRRASGRLNFCIKSHCCHSYQIMKLSTISFKTQAEKLVFVFLLQKSLNFKMPESLSQFDNGLYLKDSGVVRVSGNPVNGSASVLHKTRDQCVKTRDERDFWAQGPACVPSSTLIYCWSEETNLSSFCCSFWAPTWVR